MYFIRLTMVEDRKQVIVNAAQITEMERDESGGFTTIWFPAGDEDYIDVAETLREIMDQVPWETKSAEALHVGARVDATLSAAVEP